MKKYLITSAAALALCGLITSCTHELDYEASIQSSVVKKYEDAFVTAFGKPDPNQEWGFGSSTVATTRGTRTYDDRPEQPSFRGNPGMPTEYKSTLSEAKNISGIQNLNDVTPNYGGVYYIDGNEWDNTQPWKKDIQNVSVTIYFDGNVIFGGNNYQENDGTTYCVTENSTLKLKSVRNNLKVFLARNAILDLTDMEWSTFQNPNSAIYMSEGSKIKANYLQFVNKVTVLNNGESITAKYINVDKSFVYNNGTINVSSTGTGENDGKIIIKNSEGNFGDNQYKSELVNNGTLTANSLYVEGNSRFYNTLHHTTTISGHTDIKNGDDCWMNDGIYKTGTFTIQGQAKHIYNNCKLVVTGEFKIWESDSRFVLQGDASLECYNFTWKQARFYMGSKSLLKVNNLLYSENGNSGGYGFHGPSGNNPYAVIQAKTIDCANGEWGRAQYSMAYFGNLYIDAESHFPQGGGNAQQPWIYYDNSVKFSFTFNDFYGNPVNATESPVSIPKSECSPGYNDEEHHEDIPGVIRVIAEDLSVTQASDWDFNDVVFDVQLADNNTKVKVTLLAAGGTLPLVIGGVDAEDYHEVHAEFAKANPTLNISTQSMINTRNTGSKYTFRGCNERTFYLDAKSEWFANAGEGDDALVKAVAKNMPVEVYKMENGTKTWVLMKCDKGEPAAKIAVGTDYNWCDERDDIRDEFVSTYGNGHYSNFTLYVKGIIDGKWYKNETITKEQADRY